ncbi:hypothetical protein F4805DRAFT_457089 [Annulohypoxylon moriforme]|nr:hypothetical protein F4805DRAFT_457089 [Annulohypoxylon moriforme]
MLAECNCDSTLDIITSNRDRGKKIKIGDLNDFNSQRTLWSFDPEGKVVLIVAKANKIRECKFCRQTLTKWLHMPRFWWSNTYKRMNGYFGSESTRSSEGTIESCSSWSRALVKHFTMLPGSVARSDIHYRWLKFNIFTRWVMPDKMVIFAFDPVDIIEEWLREEFLQHLNPEELENPFWPYTRILEELVSLQGTSVWSLRNLIRTTELSPLRDHRNARHKPKYNYTRLHDIARHAIHVSETLDLSVKLSENILQEHKHLAPSYSIPALGISTGAAQMSKQIYHNMRSQISFFSNALFSLRCRSSSNHQRLNNEIQLRFHSDSQYDSQVSVEINHSTKSDSASMRWIAIVSLVFLPANLVSSIFSTTFFNGSDGSLSVSSDFWIYWVILIVVTAVTMVFWFYLPRLSPDVDTRRDKFNEEKEAENSLRNLIRSPNREGTDIDLMGRV